jgi:hypothetical protein
MPGQELFKSERDRMAIKESVAVYTEVRHPAGDAVPYPYAFVEVGRDDEGVGVAGSDHASIESLRATVAMLRLFAGAMVSDPSQDGAEPWQAVLDAASKRNTTPGCKGVAGKAGGTGAQIVRDSRTQFYVSAANAAISALEHPKDRCLETIISFAAEARGMSPLDLDSCVSKLREERGNAALARALSIGGTDSPTRTADVCANFAQAEAWCPALKPEISGNPLFESICLTSSSLLNQQRIVALKHVKECIENLMSGRSSHDD